DRADVLEIERRNAVDDRARARESLLSVHRGHQDGELVAAEPERLATLAEALPHLAEHAVAGGMAEAIVDPLEVVDVDEAERERLVLLLGDRELALQALVEVPVVAEVRERIGEREPHRAERAIRRALVERDREQRADQHE